MAASEDERNEKLGRAIVNITWIAFAARFIVVAAIIALVILYLIGKPLWLALVFAIGAFIVYRLIWRLVWKFIEWASKQR